MNRDGYEKAIGSGRPLTCITTSQWQRLGPHGSKIEDLRGLVHDVIFTKGSYNINPY